MSTRTSDALEPVLSLDLSGIGVRIAGAEKEIGERLAREWAPFVADVDPFLELRVTTVDREYRESEYRPKAMRSELLPNRARFEMPEGTAVLERQGVAQVELLRGIGERAHFTLINLLRACLAWRLPQRGGALLHAAGLVVDGLGFALVGPEGSGKSTWVRLGEEAGARPLSDDLVLVDGVGECPLLLGSPFRSTHRADYRPGRWPLSAILFPAHGAVARVDPVSPLLARARVLANLPFIADAPADDPSVGRLVERMTATVPCAQLSFAPDGEFVQLLREWAARG
jgi:hypothetical protein